MANRQYSAIGVKGIWYGEPLTEAPSAVPTANLKAVKNVHQDTWSIEENEASQDSYRNQLTGSVYRMGQKTMGDVVVNFTIGRYDHQLKAELLGGTATETSWARPRGIVNMRKTIVALTEDNQYVVLPYANIQVREANTDGAIGLAVSATMMEPQVDTIMPEYWFDAGETESALLEGSASGNADPTALAGAKG